MNRRLLFSALPGERRAILWQNGILEAFAIDRAGSAGFAGSLVEGRIARFDKPRAVAYLALDDGGEGWIALNDLPPGSSEGDRHRFIVAKPAAPGKSVKLSLLEEGKEEGESDGFLAWLKHLPAPDELAGRDDLPSGLWPEAKPALRGPLEAAGVAALDSLAEPVVPLAGGGWLLIEPGQTLTAIDVNSGRDARTAAEINADAAATAVSHIGLRALSGLIVIDFLPQEPREERRALMERLQKGLGALEGRVEVEMPSPSGVSVIHRQRLRPAFHETLGDPFTAAQSALRLAISAKPSSRLRLSCSPAVAALLSEGAAGEARLAVEAMRGHLIEVEADPKRRDADFEIL